MEFNPKKYFNETSTYAVLAVAVFLIILLVFIDYTRFLYHAVNDPFTLTKKPGSTDMTDFSKDDYLFVLKNLGYQVPAAGAQQKNTPASASSAANVVNPDFASVNVQILNNASANGATVANNLKKTLANLGFNVAAVGPTTQTITNTQIRVKDSVKSNLPNAYNQIQLAVKKVRALDVPQTLESDSTFDVVIVIGSAKP